MKAHPVLPAPGCLHRKLEKPVAQTVALAGADNLAVVKKCFTQP
jgi:hypothetical protein